jgi:hypothetical protein
MSIISDITSTLSGLGTINDFAIYAYPIPSPSIDIGIYGVLGLGVQQQNLVSVKPLEQSNFTTDSVQIKPYSISIRGVLYPGAFTLASLDYDAISDYIEKEIQTLRNYENGTQLFTLSNTFSFGKYEPLKLLSVNYFVNTDITIPEVTLNFIQVQSSTAVSYSTAQVSQVSQPMNKPRISA